jgi:hypothetical protein
MKLFLTFILSLFSLTLFAQDKKKILEDKVRPITFQVEKTLSTALKDRLQHELPEDKIGIEVRLKIDIESLAKKMGLSLDSSKKTLPGLDESKQIIDDKLMNFQPSSSDIISSTESLGVLLNSTNTYTKDQKNEIRKLIESELSTLGINNINVNFNVSKGILKVTEKKAEEKKDSSVIPTASPSQTQESLRPLLYTLIGSVIIFSGLVAFSLFLGFQKIEKLSKEVSSGLSNLALAGTGTQAPVTNTQQRPQDMTTKNVTSTEVERYDDLLKKLQGYFSKPQRVQEYFNFVLEVSDASKMLVLMESVSEEERTTLQGKIPGDFKKRYEQTISQMNQDQSLEKNLTISAKEMVSDTKMMIHDPTFLMNKALSLKVQQLKRNQVHAFFVECEEAEFSQVIQLMDPVVVASTLSQDPGLMDRFKYLSGQKLNDSGLKKLSEKLNRFINQDQDLSVAHRIANFLSPDIEAEFNRKLGKTTTIWDDLSEEHLVRLENFARSLPIAQLSALLAITPESVKTRILNRLPDIKSQQLQRFGIKLTDESFKLKNEFFTQNDSGIVQ